MRGIDCAHSRSAKTPPSSCFRENVDFSTIFVRQTSHEFSKLEQLYQVLKFMVSDLKVMVSGTKSRSGNLSIVAASQFSGITFAKSIPCLKLLRYPWCPRVVSSAYLICGIFALRECAQSIPRIKLSLYKSYREKIFCRRLTYYLDLLLMFLN
jgi:hypothetical protein